MNHHLTAIVSGGAAGAERGALRAAVDLDLGYGGWRWHDDEVPPVYAIRMRPARSRAWQRRLNVQDSDATLFVMRRGSKEMKFIVDACRAMRKPAKTLTLGDRLSSDVADALRSWISERRISVLNVVGDANEDETHDALVTLFESHQQPTSGDKLADAVNGLLRLSGQDTPVRKSGDACSSQRIVSDGSNPSPDTEQCHTCGAKPGESHTGNPGDFGFESNGQCPTCGAWAAFTEGGTDA